LDQLLLVDLIRYVVVAVRYFWFVRVRRRLMTYEPAGATATGVAKNTVAHNLKGLRDLAVNRSHLLVRPLSVIESLSVNARILSVGPRTEGELFNLAAHGFSLRNITGLDLISYSPLVELGDVHQTRFPVDSFDAVVLGWVLAYSEDMPRAAAEVVRITRTGGLVAVGVEFHPKSQEQILRESGYIPGAQRRISSCEEILELFRSSVDHVYYKHLVPPTARQQVGAFCVIFSIRKPNARA
jgi:hypothetical protein